jgi:UDP-N-acetylmuramoylalanine--D-glutamate ligase
MTIEQYLDELNGKRVAVIGIGVSNTPLIELLLNAGIAVTACDKRSKEEFDGLAEQLEASGATLCLGADYLEHLDHDIIFRTPGMRPDVPALVNACAGGSVLTSEMEVFFEVCPCPIIAVTGSDGKTTTTTIIAGLLASEGRTVFLGGNIGKPLLAEVPQMKAGDIAVLELSSFQLMTMTHSPNIAVMTNLAPNHLDMHTSMEEYIAAKENIFTHQSPENKIVFNQDNEITRGLAQKAPGIVTMFTREEPLEQGVYLKDDVIWCNGRGVLPLADILLPGVHNIENYMAAIAALDGMVSDDCIRQYAKTFGGVEHRIELVCTKDDVRYYNDSIASSPTRTIAGLHSFHEKVILIAGGYDKKIPFDKLGPEIVRHVKCLILTGDTAQKIRASVEQAHNYTEGHPKLLQMDDFEQAILTAHQEARAGDVVLFSPACASFDKFKNFAERGLAFKKLILSL